MNRIKGNMTHIHQNSEEDVSNNLTSHLGEVK